MSYQEWIDQNYPTPESAYGACERATIKMAGAFPELRRVGGHYDCPLWGRRAHWWCVAPDGSIVDPTARQFPSQGLAGEYEEVQEDTLVKVGVCMDCGKPLMLTMESLKQGVHPPTFCNEECAKNTERMLNQCLSRKPDWED